MGRRLSRSCLQELVRGLPLRTVWRGDGVTFADRKFALHHRKQGHGIGNSLQGIRRDYANVNAVRLGRQRRSIVHEKD